jgi:hypothetical protein
MRRAFESESSCVLSHACSQAYRMGLRAERQVEGGFSIGAASEGNKVIPFPILLQWHYDISISFPEKLLAVLNCSYVFKTSPEI